MRENRTYSSKAKGTHVHWIVLQCCITRFKNKVELNKKKSNKTITASIKQVRNGSQIK